VNAPDPQTYYRHVTDVDIGEIARELLGSRITQESRQTLFCDCPNHASQSHRSLHVSLEEQCWYCWGCGVGGDVLHLVEFVHHGVVTRGQSGRMPESHRQARDFLAARVGLPPLSKLASGKPEEAEAAYQTTIRVREALTALAELYHQRLLANPEVLAWFQKKYGIGNETIARLKIGLADDGEPSAARALMDGPGAFTMRELTATSAFRPTAQDGIVPFFVGRIVFPYWSRGSVVFMIGRRTPWTPDQPWEKSKYKKLAVRNERDHAHVAPCIQNDVLYNEDVLLTRPERVIITEGVTDCISLMQHGFPAVSPVTVQIREADWERLLPKLRGVKTVYVCQDNEVSEAGMQGALKTARILADHGITTRVAILPLGDKQRAAREKLAAGAPESEELLADAKIDVNEFFASGKTAADFEAILADAQTPLELAISKLSADVPDADLSRLLEPVLAEVGRLDPIEQDRHLRLIQERVGKRKVPVGTLRKQLKVVELNTATRRRHARGGSRAPAGGEPHAAEEGLPAIQINNRQLYQVAADAWRAIHALNGELSSLERLPYFLFRRQDSLVRLCGSQKEGIEIETVTEGSLFALLVLAANWVKVTEEAVLNVHPPADLTRVMSHFPDPALPQLEAVLRTPVFGRSGRLVAEPGYHRDEKVWLNPLDTIDLSEIPDAPSAGEIAAARTLLLDELLGDFPFVSRSDAAHAVAAMIFPFVRRLFSGPSPIHLIEAPRQGSGKGLLANVISLVAHGVPCDTKTLPDSEDEIRKLLTTELLKARPVILLDNVDERKSIISRALAAITTAEIWSDRMLGSLEDVRVPNLALWLMTGNNPKLTGDMPRRCVRIRIDPKIDRPWKRAGFRHPDLVGWIRENRPRLVRAVIVLVKAWLAAGRPLHTVRLGSYEAWSATIGGILQAAGIPGFLESLDELYDAADSEGQEWRRFTAAWWEAFEAEPKKVSELNELCEREGLMLDLRGDRSERSQQTRLGNALHNRRDQVFDRYRIVKVDPQTKHKGAAMYALQMNASGRPTPTGPVDLGTLGTFGDLGFEGPQTLSPIDPISFGEVGDLGDLGGDLRARDSKKEEIPGEGDFLNFSHAGMAETGLKVPKVPKPSAIDTKQTRSDLGTLDAEVPKRSPNVPRSPNGGIGSAIDLARLPDSGGGRDDEPP